jgi:hypothetical protein
MSAATWQFAKAIFTLCDSSANIVPETHRYASVAMPASRFGARFMITFPCIRGQNSHSY